LVRVVAREGSVAFDLSARARGRGAYVHARPGCLDKAPAAMGRALRIASRGPELSRADLAIRLATACDRRMASLLASARRARSVRAADVATSSDAIHVVATDASVRPGPAVERAIARGRALAWGRESDLGELFGRSAAASCAVEHPSLAAQLVRTRAAADAASSTTHTSMQSSRRPEVR
jgi:hypothetical protein